VPDHGQAFRCAFREELPTKGSSGDENSVQPAARSLIGLCQTVAFRWRGSWGERGPVTRQGVNQRTAGKEILNY